MISLKNFKFIDRTNGSIKDDILSGLTVALALVPEAVAFAFVAGISPIVGLYGAFMMGLVTSIFGGRPGMISGATGALAVVMVHLVSEGNTLGGDSSMGLQYLFATLIFGWYYSNCRRTIQVGKICTYDTPLRNVRFCQWISNCDFLIPIRHVQKQWAMARRSRHGLHDRFGCSDYGYYGFSTYAN